MAGKDHAKQKNKAILQSKKQQLGLIQDKLCVESLVPLQNEMLKQF